MRDCGQAFKVSSIPCFIFFVNGKQHSTFTGAYEYRLKSTLFEIGEMVSTRVNKHKEMDFQ
jgi:thioredoxin-like negative regulator of GroEL